jgi:uncharacterized protein DUF1549/uncharacterized protein DUF1553/cytochrome c
VTDAVRSAMRTPFVATFVAAGIVGWSAAMLAQQSAPSRPARAAAAQRPTATGGVDFAGQIQPILEAKCLECHSATRRKGGLSLANYGDILEGGKDGAIVRPGRGVASQLIQRLTGEADGDQMPKDDPPLPAGEIALIRRWIDQGARATPGGPPAPQPWDAPLTLAAPPVPPRVWPEWDRPADRLVADYLRAQGVRQPPAAIGDAAFARRAYLDAWGLLPTPEQLQAFLDDPAPAKRDALVRALLADGDRYADHWMSFWNDLLRNEDGVTYFSEQDGRRSITPWLLPALRDNLPYDRFVRALLDPSAPGDPEGFLIGVNWRGVTSAAVTPSMQASQNTAQAFLGVNLKCTACHDSFVNKWKLKDAYGLAAYFAPEGRLQLFRCDVAQERYAEPGFLYPGVGQAPKSPSLADRRAAAAATFTDPRLGRLPRTIVNRLWQRLLGQGIVANPDEMDGRPWSPALLDWLASDLVAHGYDLRHTLAAIMTSRAYQMEAVARRGELPATAYVFRGPEIRRLTAEQFTDAIGSITGEWGVAPTPAPAAPARKPGAGEPLPSQPTTTGTAAREWRTPSSSLTRALGRPIRDQVTSMRSAEATTLQALELTNGAELSQRLARGAQRMLGVLPADRVSLYTRAVEGRRATSSRFAVDVSQASRLWLVVEDTGSNVPAAMLPAWADAELVGTAGATPLSALTPVSATGLRDGGSPVAVPEGRGGGIRVRAPSVLVYDIAGRGVTQLTGVIGLENKTDDIGSTLNPALRFYVFDGEPDLDRLLPPKPGAPFPRPAALTTVPAVVDRVYRHALGRAPTEAERRVAETALRAPDGDRPSPDGLADLLWAIVMMPEFQLLR